MIESVYLDHNATTPPAAEAIEEMLESLRALWANPSSTHAPGQDARRALADARDRAREDDAATLEVREPWPPPLFLLSIARTALFLVFFTRTALFLVFSSRARKNRLVPAALLACHLSS